MTELDYGTLLCSATNKIGKQKHPCIFHIIAAGKDDVKILNFLSTLYKMCESLCVELSFSMLILFHIIPMVFSGA